MRVIKNIQYGGFPDNQLDLYLPQDTGFATIVYFHGGGLESGDKADKTTKKSRRHLWKTATALRP